MPTVPRSLEPASLRKQTMRAVVAATTLIPGTPLLCPFTSTAFMSFADLRLLQRRSADCSKPLKMALWEAPVPKTAFHKAQGRVAGRLVSLQYLGFAIANSCQRWIGKLF